MHTCISSGKPTTKIVEISSPFAVVVGPLPFAIPMETEVESPGGIFVLLLTLFAFEGGGMPMETPAGTWGPYGVWDDSWTPMPLGKAYD